MKLCVILFLVFGLSATQASAETTTELVEKAKAEPYLNVGTNELAYGYLLLEVFGKKYPFLKIHHMPFDAVPGMQHFYDAFESESADDRVDVMLRCQDEPVLDWIRSGWLADLSSLPNWDNRPKNAEEDVHFVNFLGAPHVIIYDPNKIKEADLPKSYDEILDPKWKGKVAFRDPLRGNSGAFFTHFIRETRGSIDWFKKFAMNKPFIAHEGYGVLQAVNDGKYLIGLSRDVEVFGFDRLLLERTGKKSKLKFKLLERELPFQYQMLTMSKNAPHSAAGRLFANWILSAEAREVLEKAGYSVGERQQAQLGHPKTWRWEMLKPGEKLTRESHYSLLFAARRTLLRNGAQFERKELERSNASAED